MNLKLDYKAKKLAPIDMKVEEAAMEHIYDLDHIKDFEKYLSGRMIDLNTINIIKVQKGPTYKVITNESSGTVELWRIYWYGAYKKLLLKFSVIVDADFF